MPEGRKIGDWIADRYEIHDIHDGGMGVVYIVYDHQGQPGRRVLAIKTLKDELLADRRQRSRFVAECETWIKLDRHPNIVRAYSVQEIDGKPHALLELVTGGDLRRWIGTPRLDPVQAIRFGVQFCLAMEHAVRKGLHCHRDIKPENLLVTEGGTLKITDFGLAKVRDEAADNGLGEPIPLAEGGNVAIFGREPFGREPVEWTLPLRTWSDPSECEREPGVWVSPIDLEATIDRPARLPSPANGLATVPWFGGGSTDPTDLDDPLATVDIPRTADDRSLRAFVDDHDQTVDGAVLGTAAYMAPEQFRNAKTVDIRADVYSFGIVLFEMIATRRPFRGDTYRKLARQHERASPPSIVRFLPLKQARIARPLDRIIQRCLAKDPAKRFAGFFELRRELAKCLWAINRERVTIPAESDLEAWELNNKGVSLGTLGRYDEERESYEESIRVKPDHVPAWFNQAAALGSIARPADALEYADVALLLNPSSVPALLNKALALHVLNRSEAALALFDRAARLHPREPEVWYGRGYVLLRMGNSEGAKSALRQALRLRPTYPEALEALALAISGDSGKDPAGGDRPFAETLRQGPRGRLRSIPWVRRTEDSAAVSPS